MIKKPRPGDRGRERGGSGFSSELINNASAASVQPPQPFARLDDLTLAEVRALWWRMRCQGVCLHAQGGVILISNDGERWPRPRTQRPQPEAGGPGGRA